MKKIKSNTISNLLSQFLCRNELKQIQKCAKNLYKMYNNYEFDT